MPALASPICSRQVHNEELDAILQRRRRAGLLIPAEIAESIADATQELSVDQLAEIALRFAPFDYAAPADQQREMMRNWAEAAKASRRDEVRSFVLAQFPGGPPGSQAATIPEDDETRGFHQVFHTPHPYEPILRGLLRKHVADDLVGLALSGGGIRSASFNLGVIEALQQHGMLRRVDLMATVSGGGYMGSHLSSAMLQPEAGLEENNFPLQAGPDGRITTHVRNMIHGGKYLNHPARLVNRYLVGLFYNNLVFLTLLLVGCLAAALVWRGLDQYPVHTFLSWISGGNLIDVNRPFLPCLVALVAWLLCWGAAYWSWLCGSMPIRQRVFLEIAISTVFLALSTGTAYQNVQLWSSPFWPFLLNFSVFVVLLMLTWWHSWKSCVFGSVLMAFLVAWLVAVEPATRDYLVGQTARILTTPVTLLPWLLVCGVSHWKEGIAGAVRWQKRFLLLAGIAFLVGWAVWLGIPNINTVSSRQDMIVPGLSKDIEDIQSSVLPYFLAALAVALIPFLKPRELFRSGERPKSQAHRLIFQMASFALLGGIPLIIVFWLAHHNFSGHADDLGRKFTSTDIRNWESFWPKLFDAEKKPMHFVLERCVARNETAMKPLSDPRELARLERRGGRFIDPSKTEWSDWVAIEHQRDAVMAVLNAVMEEESATDEFLAIPEMAERMRQLAAANADPKRSGKNDLNAAERSSLKVLRQKHDNDGLSLESTSDKNDQALLKKERAMLNRLLLRAQFPDDIWQRDRIRRSTVIQEDQLARLRWLAYALAGLLVFGLVVNANATSPHWFYRDQLAKAYIVPRAKTDTVAPDGAKRWKYEILLKDMDTTSKGAPYHLICAAINHADADMDRLLDSSHFLFSQKYCGSEVTQFESTETYLGGEMDLPSAMAISGAAVSPMQVHNPLVAVIMTILNLRLGQWLPRPGHANQAASPLLEMIRQWPTFGGLFVDRALAWEDPAARKYYFLSDGGHDENLGLEQLLARRCRLMIVSDAGQDQEHMFADLAKVYRRVRLQGIRMWRLDRQGEAMSLDNLILDKANGTCRDHYLLVRVRYPDETEALLVYLKPSFRGAEELDLRYFRSQNPAFPHDPTAQVMYEPDQVESYRQLGYNIGDKIGKERFANMDGPPEGLRAHVESILAQSQSEGDYAEFPLAVKAALGSPPTANGAAGKGGRGKASAASSELTPRRHAEADRLP